MKYSSSQVQEGHWLPTQGIWLPRFSRAEESAPVWTGLGQSARPECVGVKTPISRRSDYWKYSLQFSKTTLDAVGWSRVRARGQTSPGSGTAGTASSSRRRDAVRWTDWPTQGFQLPPLGGALSTLHRTWLLSKLWLKRLAWMLQ